MLAIWLLISFQPFQNLGKLKLKETVEKERELQQMLTFWASIVIISNFLTVITMIRGIMGIISLWSPEINSQDIWANSPHFYYKKRKGHVRKIWISISGTKGLNEK